MKNDQRARRAITLGALVMIGAGVAGCGARSTLDSGLVAGEPECVGETTCVAPGKDACAAPVTVAAVCDGPGRAFHCPAGAAPYTRAADAPGVCLPFSDSASNAAIGGSLVRVPTDDGRCLWIAEDFETDDAEHLRNVAFAPSTGAAGAFGVCPKGAPIGQTPASIVRVDGFDDPDVEVQISGAFRFGGATRVTYRLFRLDADAPFGVVLLGSGLGSWKEDEQHVVVGDASSLQFGVHLDLGDASWVGAGGAHVWGCPRQQGLVDGCVEARFDASGAMQLLGANRTWLATADPAMASTVLTSGPWISSIVGDGGGLLHVFAEGFGSTLETQTATVPEGPWSAGPTLAECALPADSKAFCAGPVVHDELRDPTRPDEIVVSYGVGTTAPAGPIDAAASWPRLVWIER